MRQMGLSGVKPAAPAIRCKAYAPARTRPEPQQSGVSCFRPQRIRRFLTREGDLDMRRLGLILTLVALVVAGLTTTNASALVAGIGDQNASTFSDSNFKKLKVKRTRLIVAWDAINTAD